MLCGCSAEAAELRVCSDPANLPYSDSRQQGFENQLARMVSHDLGRTLSYYWIPQRGNFFKALSKGLCDVVMAVPSQSREAAATRPYYRSSYVFVSRRDRPVIRSFDDPALKKARIGVQVLGVDDAIVPPAQVLERRGLLRNIAWYRVYQTYITPSRPDLLLDAVARGEVDVAIAWGPVAGYFARLAATPLAITPVSPAFHSQVPLIFDISMGVRPADKQLLASLNAFIEHRRSEIRRVLTGFGVPLVGGAGIAKAVDR